MNVHLPDMANLIAFAAFVVALSLGWLWHAYRIAVRDAVRADMRESLLDRIARDELAPFFAEWDAEVTR
jgi:hypothetical protein